MIRKEYKGQIKIDVKIVECKSNVDAVIEASSKIEVHILRSEKLRANDIWYDYGFKYRKFA